MKEQIKELADQAGVSITAADKNGVFTLLPDKQKKFAELIVMRCLDIVNREALFADHASAEVNQYAIEILRSAYIKIEEHFEIKE